MPAVAPSPAPIPLTRPAVAALVADPSASARSLEEILAADARGDHGEACARALARVLAGEPLPAAVMAQLFLGAPTLDIALGLAAIADGDRAAALLDVVERDRFSGDPTGLMHALFAAHRFGAAPALRPRLIAQLRRASRIRLALEELLLLATLARDLDDPHLNALAAYCRDLAASSITRERIAGLEAELAQSAAQVLAVLPAVAETTPMAPAGFTVRTGPKPGRNDPCPCGSGQKYKRCCADKPAVAAPSPKAGVSWHDYLREGAGRLTVAELERLELADLSRVDLSRLGDLQLITVLRTATGWRRWDLASRALAAMDARGRCGEETADDWRAETITHLLQCNEVELARAELGRLRDPAVVGDPDRLHLFLLEHPDAVPAALTAAAEAAIADPHGAAENELAHVLLQTSPALGVLVARACLRPDRLLDAEVLLDVIEEARDQLGLPPGDPGWTRLEEMEDARASDGPEEEDEADDEPDEEAEQLRAELRAARSRLAELEAQQKAERRAAERRGPASPPKPSAATAEELAERREARDKLELLQQRIREGNEERAALRRKLAEAAGEAPAPVRRPDIAPAPADEPDEPGAPAVAPRRPLVPRFERRAEDALVAVPSHVAAEALRTLGMIAAGDAAAWRGIKQAKDMTRPVLMARVGIHHRLLLAVEDRTLQVLDLVTREELLHTLKRLRG